MGNEKTNGENSLRPTRSVIQPEPTQQRQSFTENDFDFTKDFTLSFWFKLQRNSLNARKILEVTIHDAPTKLFRVNLLRSKTFLLLRNGKHRRICKTVPTVAWGRTPSKYWHHFKLSVERNQLCLFLDGHQIACESLLSTDSTGQEISKTDGMTECELNIGSDQPEFRIGGLSMSDSAYFDYLGGKQPTASGDRQGASSNGGHDSSTGGMGGNENHTTLPTERDLCSGGINIITYYDSFGVGQHGHYLEKIFIELGIAVNFIKIKKWESESTPAENIKTITTQFNYGYLFVLFSFNYNEPHYMNVLNLPAGYIKVGLWAWELEKFPHKYLQAELNEIWTISNFALNSINNVSSTKVVNIYPPVLDVEFDVGDYGKKLIDKYKLGKMTTFLTFFDMKSCPFRKNPFDLLDIFLEQDYHDKLLLVKVSNFEPNYFEKYLECENIKFIDEDLSYADVLDLYKISDIYVSTAKSEGQGRSIIEALQCGVKVFAVNYSAMSEFYHNDNINYLDHEMVAVDSEIYKRLIDDEPCVWAKMKKSELMRNIENINGKQPRDLKKRDYIENYLSVKKSAEIVANRLFSLKKIYIHNLIKHKLKKIPNIDHLLLTHVHLNTTDEGELRRFFENTLTFKKYSYSNQSVVELLKSHNIEFKNSNEKYFDIDQKENIEFKIHRSK